MTNEMELINAVYEFERLAISLAFMDFGQQGFQAKLDELAIRRTWLVNGIRGALLTQSLSPEAQKRLETLRERRVKIEAEPSPF